MLRKYVRNLSLETSTLHWKICKQIAKFSRNRPKHISVLKFFLQKKWLEHFFLQQTNAQAEFAEDADSVV